MYWPDSHFWQAAGLWSLSEPLRFTSLTSGFTAPFMSKFQFFRYFHRKSTFIGVNVAPAPTLGPVMKPPWIGDILKYSFIHGSPLGAGNTSSLCAAEFRVLCVTVEDKTSSQHFITASMRSWTVSWDVFGLTGGNTQISESRCAPSSLFWLLCSSVQREQTAIMQRLRVNMAEDAGPVKRSSGTGLSDGQSNTCKLTFLINDFISDTNVVFLLFSVRNYKMTEAGITFCFILYKNQRNINLMHHIELKFIYSFMSLILMIQFYLSGFISDKIG